MSKKSNKAKKSNDKDDPNFKTVCRNRKARRDYEILDELNCGIALRGSEVKSIRNGKISIDEAYVKVRNGELWLIGCDIAEYPQATVMNHEPRNPRKLLVRKSEFRKFAEVADNKGLTMIPMSVYFSRGFVKVRIAVARGKKMHDKRDDLRKQEDSREMRMAKLNRNS